MTLGTSQQGTIQPPWFDSGSIRPWDSPQQSGIGSHSPQGGQFSQFGHYRHDSEEFRNGIADFVQRKISEAVRKALG